MDDWLPVLRGIGWAALIGGGFRAALVAVAVRRGAAHPPERAPLALAVFGSVAAAGLVLLVALAVLR